ncbi:E3 ubiquitin-protein ligase TRIM58-like [Thamnophis elegans]|uniref:E3 ubiquitin-protein ligase TRIM58-like n=1 Tax=Thamnophis elegans TaxID=35005 RepID=UPI001377FFAC|nr:E3 ubiquitin-protein ligase TRIM58-like [Thamnophis elegans]
MAASGEQRALGQLGQEATCPLCLDFFERPMVLSCGHNFCHHCLAQRGTRFSCPQCRAQMNSSSACPKLTLASIACRLKGLRMSQGAQEESNGHRLCQEHGQPLQSSCSSEERLLCPGCRGAPGPPPPPSRWEVSVEEEDCVPVGGRARWAIGRAKESVRRKGSFQLSPQEGIWALGKRVGWGEMIAFSKDPQKVILRRAPRRLWVRLGYEAETVEFLDAETEISLYTFQTGPLLGETLRPFFYGGPKRVTLQWEENPPATKGFM